MKARYFLVSDFVPLNKAFFAGTITGMNNTSKKGLSAEESQELLGTLKERFEKNTDRHKGLLWSEIKARLEADPRKLWSLSEMERTGGEPDVVGFDGKNREYIIFDCSKESPKGRRSLCYDREAWEARKTAKPANNVLDVAAEMGVELLTEDQYRNLQELGEFDTKTSSWIVTPQKIRNLGGAIFADRRFDHIFVYHNGADAYYASRGFRACLKI